MDPKKKKALSLCGRRPHGEAACALSNKNEERLYRAAALQPISFKPVPAVVAGEPGRRVFIQQPHRRHRRCWFSARELATSSHTCYLSPPRDWHFLSVTGGLLPVQRPLWWRWLTANHLLASAPALKSRPLIWLFTQSSAPEQATGSSLQINEALQLPREGYIKYQSCVLFYNIITLAINP